MSEFSPKFLRRDQLDALFEQAHCQIEARRVQAEINVAISEAVEGVDDPLVASEKEIKAVKELHRRMVDSALVRTE